MVFSSNIFIFIFLPIVLATYFLVKRKYKNYVLLVSSLFFYGWGGIKNIPILLASIGINYVFGILIDKYKRKNEGIYCKWLLSIGIFLNLIILIYYKYFNFIASNANSILNFNIALRNIVLPIGISFFTFQGMSYIIDIYRNDAKVNKNIFSVALYISLFPQLVAGPIVKYKDIDNEIRYRKESVEGFSYGIQRFIIGLAKKVIIADVLGAIAANILSLSYGGIDIPTAWLGAICYTMQIYYDFSGYSDMAIGIGHFFGFKFQENFNYPYISKSITEFWRRWHISLSTWFKQYLYIPLGGNRRGNVYVNLFIVFLVTGIWHGASWNFIVWGMWHGVFILIERMLSNKNWYKKIPASIKWVTTILIVIIGWVLFSANTLTNAINYIAIMFGLIQKQSIAYEISYFMTFKIIFWIVIAVVLSTPLTSKICKIYKNNTNENNYEILKTIILIIIFVLSIVFIINSDYSPFIYFQF